MTQPGGKSKSVTLYQVKDPSEAKSEGLELQETKSEYNGDKIYVLQGENTIKSNGNYVPIATAILDGDADQPTVDHIQSIKEVKEVCEQINDILEKNKEEAKADPVGFLIEQNKFTGEQIGKWQAV